MEPPKPYHDQAPHRPSPLGKSSLSTTHNDTGSSSTESARLSTVAPQGSGFLSIFDSRTEVADWEKFKAKCIEAYGASATELDSIRFVFDPRCEGYVARNLWLKLREAFPVLASPHAAANPQAWRLGEIAGLLAPPAQVAFHAWAGREDAAALLAGRPLGTFLWRFGTAGHLSLAVVCPPAPSASAHSSRDSDAPVRHWRIVVKGRQRLLFTTSNSQQRVFRTLTDIEEHYRREPLVIAPGHSVLLGSALARGPYPPPPPVAVPQRSSSLGGSSSQGPALAPAPGAGRLPPLSGHQRWAWPAADSPGGSSPAGSQLAAALHAQPQAPLLPPSQLAEVRGERAQSSPPPQLFMRPVEAERLSSSSAALGAGAGIVLGAGYQRRLPPGGASPASTPSPSPPWLLQSPAVAAAVGRDGYHTSLPSSGSSQLASPLASALDSGTASSSSSLSTSSAGGLALSLDAAGERGAAAEQYKEIDYNELVIRYPPVGGGAFGMVYRGTWRGADVAVKQLHAADLDLDELRREARVWQRLAHHPNVAHLVGACTRQYPFCLVSDYYTKGSLFDILIKRREPVEWPHVLHVLLTAAVGIAHLHKEQVIHRDVSARNILVQVVDDQWIAKVSDFGLARVKSSAAAAQSRSAGGAIKWMSPELLLAHRYSERSDAYSFGVTLWECFYRSEPYPDVAPAALALQVCRSDAPLRPELDARCPPPYADLMRACWAPEPDARPPFHDIHEQLRVYYEALRPPPS